MAEPYLKMIDNWIYFGHLDKYAIIPTYPDTIQDSMSVTFSTENALSRSAPVFTYSYSGPRQVQVGFKLHREMLDLVNKDIGNLKDNVLDFKNEDYIDVLIRYLQACALPKYSEYKSGAKAVEPPWVALKLGNTIFIKGIINSSIGVTWEKPILSDDKYAICDISFTIYETDPYDAVSVSEQGSFRGLTKTMKNGIYKD